jgi:SAM-dependent methyltransferase
MTIPYRDRFADWYDTFYADKSYAQEARFVHKCLSRSGAGVRRLLELACGTANHAFEFERLGYQVLATDVSVDMLRCARQKKLARDSAIELRQMDMRRIDLPARSFDAVICLFDSIGYAQTNQAVSAVMSKVHQVLRSGGIFIFEFWHAAAMLKYYEPVRVRRWKTPQGELERISETQIDYLNNLATVNYTVYEAQAEGGHRCYRETHKNRFFSIVEMENFLQQSGLEALAWYAGFQENKVIQADTWHILGVTQKA